ncbi:MAG: M50 family metallopeptidase [Candidatus Coproplasma sp.]
MSNLLLSGVGSTVLSIILAILILLAMICVHEFGHFVAGRILHFKIDEFSVGFGPAVLKRRGKKNSILFSLRAIPLGGYCAFAGEDTDVGESESDGVSAENTFDRKKPYQRIIVLLAGAFFNYILAMLLILTAFFAFGQPCYKMGAIKPDESVPIEYSLKEGDLLLAVDGKNIYSAPDLIYTLKGKGKGEKVVFTVIREGAEAQTEIALRADCDFKNSSETGKVWRALGCDTYEGEDGNLYWDVGSQNVKFSFFNTVGRSFAYSFNTAGTIFRVLGELLSGNLGLNAMGGPVTTIRLTGKMALQGAHSFLLVAAYIGVNLAIFNLLPIPSLDGSKVIFCLIEWIFKKPVPRKVEAVIHTVGLILIIAFAVLVDILQFARC